jgi:arabinofuranosyltransferase
MAWHIRATYWQCDDAFISFRYVWHLLHGNGLVFNPGERVEGYTNFLWVLELAAVWKVFGLEPEVACDVLSIACTLGVVACVLQFARGNPVRERRVFIAFGALLLLAASRTWAVWSTSGLETRQFTLFVLLGMLLVSRGRGNPRRLLWASLAFTGAELTRPEAPLLWGVAGLWLLGEMAIARSFSWRDVLMFGVPFVTVVGAHYLWRHAYYGDWLPNTYDAKFVRPWPEAGVRYFAAAAIECGAWFLVPLAVLGAVWRIRRGDRLHVLTALVVLAHVAYLVRIGGDHFEWRPLDFYWPCLMLAAVEGIAAAATWVGTRTRAGFVLPSSLALLALATLYGTIVQSAKIALAPRVSSRAEVLDRITTLDAANSPVLFAVPPMAPLVGLYNDLQSYTLRHGVGTIWPEHEILWREEMANWAPYGATRGQGLPKDAVWARGVVGVSGYYLAGVTYIDTFGLTNRETARTPVDTPNETRYMAHDRRASMALLERANITICPAVRTRVDALMHAPYAVRVSEEAWMPLGARDPIWFERALQGRDAWHLELAQPIGCFDGERDSRWTATGAAFASGVTADIPATRVVPWMERCSTRFGLSSRDEAGAGRGVGVTRSERFGIEAEAVLEVRLCGTRVASVGVRVLDAHDGSVLASVSPPDPDWLLPVHVDLSPFSNREAVVEAFDESENAWVTLAGVVTLRPAPLKSD